MPKATNKDCFAYKEDYGGICKILKPGVVKCKECHFYKHKNDKKNKSAMELFHELSNLGKSNKNTSASL